MERKTDDRPPLSRYGTRIEDLRDGVAGTVLNHYGMAFAAVMDNDEVRYFGKSNPRFRLASRTVSVRAVGVFGR